LFVRGDVNRHLFVHDTLNASGLFKIFYDLRQKSRAPFALVDPNLDQAKGRSTWMHNAPQRKSPAMMRHASTVSTTRNRTLPLCICS
jgi:hypothetical protein